MTRKVIVILFLGLLIAICTGTKEEVETNEPDQLLEIMGRIENVFKLEEALKSKEFLNSISDSGSREEEPEFSQDKIFLMTATLKCVMEFYNYTKSLIQEGKTDDRFDINLVQELVFRVVDKMLQENNEDMRELQKNHELQLQLLRSIQPLVNIKKKWMEWLWENRIYITFITVVVIIIGIIVCCIYCSSEQKMKKKQVTNIDDCDDLQNWLSSSKQSGITILDTKSDTIQNTDSGTNQISTDFLTYNTDHSEESTRTESKSLELEEEEEKDVSDSQSEKNIIADDKETDDSSNFLNSTTTKKKKSHRKRSRGKKVSIDYQEKKSNTN